ncbi:hypothetical protein DL89DRAFT_265523 [Linderina pennispora]|uniref:RING-type domain-containing protein n=1 Tax=Linderina pennispora TaxID=61395 RepID=A0A1Y1WE70_9FUNG|nr:uncharacterized protein DL89DRAFT_265523 [Linderina pennispora]ORX71807.1 hypothetical protein DL89DRAFT_265523 [Linderina pennispora]
MPVIPRSTHVAVVVPSLYDTSSVPWMTSVSPTSCSIRTISENHLPTADGTTQHGRLYTRAISSGTESQATANVASGSRGGTQGMSTASVIGLVTGSLGIFIMFTFYILRRAYRRLHLNHQNMPVFSNYTAPRPQGWRKPRLRTLTDDQFKRLISSSAMNSTGGIEIVVQKAEQDVCAICLAEIEDDEKLLKLPCKHKYHQDCIQIWLTEKSERCPLCKKSVLDALGTPAIDPASVNPSTLQSPPRAVVPML